MAKEKITYICEICNTEFDSEEGANQCEQSHAADLEIDTLQYVTRKKFPQKVTLACPKDGTKQVYIKA